MFAVKDATRQSKADRKFELSLNEKQKIMNYLLKFCRILFIPCLFLSISNLSAQRNNIKVNTNLDGNVGFEYERQTNKFQSASIAFFANNKSYKPERGDYFNTSLEVSGEYRFYKNKAQKSLHGLYVAPNISLAHHSLEYEYEEIQSTSSLIGELIGLLVTGGSYPNYSTNPPKELKHITGQAKVNSTAVGLKFGVQYIWKHFNLDIGVNVSRHFTPGGKEGFVLSDGSVKAFEKDVNGLTTVGHLALGIAF